MTQKIRTRRAINDTVLLHRLRERNVALIYPDLEFEPESLDEIYELAQVFAEHGYTLVVDGEHYFIAEMNNDEE